MSRWRQEGSFVLEPDQELTRRNLLPPKCNLEDERMRIEVRSWDAVISGAGWGWGGVADSACRIYSFAQLMTILSAYLQDARCWRSGVNQGSRQVLLT